MATLKNHTFGSVISMIDHEFECTDHAITLNDDLALGNNYLIEHFIEELKSLAFYEDLTSFIWGLDTCDGVELTSNNGKRLSLVVSDLNDYL